MLNLVPPPKRGPDHWTAAIEAQLAHVIERLAFAYGETPAVAELRHVLRCVRILKSELPPAP